MPQNASRERREELRTLYEDWCFQPESAADWKDFVEATAKDEYEAGYLQGVWDRDRYGGV